MINVDAFMNVFSLGSGRVLSPRKAVLSGPGAGVWLKRCLAVKKCWQLESRVCKGQEETWQNEGAQCTLGLRGFLKTCPSSGPKGPQHRPLHPAPLLPTLLLPAHSCSCPGGLFAKGAGRRFPRKARASCMRLCGPLHVPSHQASRLPEPTQTGTESW